MFSSYFKGSFAIFRRLGLSAHMQADGCKHSHNISISVRTY